MHHHLAPASSQSAASDTSRAACKGNPLPLPPAGAAPVAAAGRRAKKVAASAARVAQGRLGDGGAGNHGASQGARQPFVFPSDDKLPAKMPLKDFAALGRGIIGEIAYHIHNGQHVAAASMWRGPLTTLCSYWLITPSTGGSYFSRPPPSLAVPAAASDEVAVAGPADGLYSADALSLDSDKGVPVAAAARAIKQALAGHAAEAMKVLLAEPPVVVTPAMRGDIGGNFLPGGVHHPVPVVKPIAFKPSVGQARVQLRRALYAVLSKKHVSKGGGVDNLSMAKLFIIVKDEGNEARLPADDLLSLVEAVRGGLFTLPEYADLCINAGQVIAKEGHTAEAPAIRTLAVATAVYRLAGAIDVKKATPKDAEAQAGLFGPMQCAIGAGGGTATPGLYMQGLIDSKPPPPLAGTVARPRLAVKWDIRKAFPSIKREAVRAVVSKYAPELIWMLEAMYWGSTSHSFAPPAGEAQEDWIFSTAVGVNAGCPLAMWAFCCAMWKCVTSKLHEKYPHIAVPAWADDNFAVGFADDMEAFTADYIALLDSELGLQLNRAKCSVFNPDGGAEGDAAVVAYALKFGFTVVQGGFVVVGTPVGTPEYCAAHVAAVGQKLELEAAKIIAALAEPGFVRMPRLMALFRVIRMCVTPAIFHLLRGLAPDVTKAAAESLDDKVFALVINACGLDHALPPVGSPSWDRVRLRFSLSKENSGLAFASARSVSDAAYLCGVLNAAQVAANLHSPCPLVPGVAWPAAAAIFAAERANMGSPLAHHATFDALIADGGAGGLQASITAAQQKRALTAAFLAAEMDAEKLVIMGYRGNSSAWISANPRFEKLSDGEICDAVAMLLHLSVAPSCAVSESRCRCCAKLQSNTGEHAHTCINGTAKQQRAGEMAAALAKALRSAGCHVIGQFGKGKERFPEQPLLAAAGGGGILGLQPTAVATGREHGDLQFEAAGETYVVDLVTIFGGGEATKKGALKKRGSAATFAENTKINKYGKRFSNIMDKLHRLIFAATEVYGTHGLRFNAMLRSVASHAVPQPYGYDIDGLRARCISRLRQQISVGVLRGNHKVLAGWRAHSWSMVAPPA